MNQELLYLLKLMDDPNSEVFNVIERKIMGYGKAAVPDLEHYWEKNQSTLVQSRIENLLQKINFNFLKQKVKEWIPNSNSKMLYGSYLVSLLQYPDIEFSDISKLFEEVKRDLWLEMNPQLTALEKIRVINHILFKVHSFKGTRNNPTNPQYFFLNNLLDTRRGNQYSLAMLYASIAQSINLPVYGVKLPNNYILAYKDQQLAQYAGKNTSDILFYINPYNNGAIFGRKELTQILQQNKIIPKPQYYKPADNIFFIEQIIKALRLTFQSLDYTEKIEKIDKLLKFIAEQQNSTGKRNT